MLAGRYKMIYCKIRATRMIVTTNIFALGTFLSLLLNSSQAFAPKYMPKYAFRPLPPAVSKQQSSDAKAEDLRKLIGEVVQIITSTGFQVGATRTLQLARAGSNLLREFVSSPQTFQGENGLISLPRTLRRLFEELGATYVKLGQFIASSPTLFPAEYVLEFQSCLDRSPTVGFSVIRDIVQEDLKKPISSVFSYVDPVPLASASIGQVHKAKLRNGTEVCIKVRKPGVETILKADLGFLYVATKLLEYINPSLSRISLSNIVGDLRGSMLDELDFKKEAANLLNFKEFLSRNGIEEVTAPSPFLSFTSTRVLTMEFLKGVPLTDLDGIKKYSSNPEATLVSALRTWALSVVDNDAFHADVHAGNLLVLEDGRVGFIDFGIVGRVSDNIWNALGSLVQGFVEGDFRTVARSLVQMGATDTRVDEERFARALEDVISKVSLLQPQVVVATSPAGTAVDARLEIDEKETTEIVLQIVAVADDNGLKLPREFGLLMKQALYFDRYQKLLAPDLDPLRDSRVRAGLEEELRRGGDGTNSFASGSRNRQGKKIVDVEAII